MMTPKAMRMKASEAPFASAVSDSLHLAQRLGAGADGLWPRGRITEAVAGRPACAPDGEWLRLFDFRLLLIYMWLQNGIVRQDPGESNAQIFRKWTGGRVKHGQVGAS
jgi:hypothetical protein